MGAQGRYDVRTEMLEALLQKVGEEQYPSSTMLDMIEELLTPDDVPVYAEMLLTRIRSERFPSIPMLARLQAFT
jgi:hypothetical protein